MRVIELRAENIKRLTAVTIRPSTDVVEITGKNASGKSSTLDAIWWALSGTSGIQAQPIRKGEERALIRLDLGDLKVTRRFTAQDDGTHTTTVTVENAEGARYPGPQAMLDAMVGKLTLDPLDFTRQPARQQFEALKRLTGVDFSELEAANRVDFDKRTEANRRGRDNRTLAGTIHVPEDATERKIDVSDLLEQIERAAAHNTDVERRAANRASAEQVIAGKQQEVTRLQAEISRLTAEIAIIVQESAELKTRLDAAPPLPERIDVSELRQQIDAAQAQNEIADRVIRKKAALSEAEHYENLADGLTEAMSIRDDEKRKMIAAAPMPVEGLGFGDDLITLGGVPFDQASDAEQLRASIAIAAAANPKLRIIRVRDGSLLDQDSMALLATFAAEKDLQVWIETVQSGRPGAIVIEDGHVAEQRKSEPEPEKPKRAAKPAATQQGDLL